MNIMPACEICKKGPMHGVSVYSNGPKDMRSPWRCEVHIDPEWVIEEDMRIAAIIEIRDRTVH